MSSTSPRYSYDLGQMETSVMVDYGTRADPDVREKEVYVEGFLVFDRLRGHVDDAHIAFCDTRDAAEKIVTALNARAS